jgi:hypothetical protein
MQRRIRLADHRGRDAVVVLVPRQRAGPRGPHATRYQDGAGAAVHFSRRIKAVEQTSFGVLRRRHSDPEALAQALIDGDPELDLEAVGCEAGPCDRVYLDVEGRPLYSAQILEVLYDRDGNELERQHPQVVPANLVPDTAPVWSGKLLALSEAARRFAFTRAYQVRHSNALEYDFLYGLAAYLEERKSMILVGAGPRGVGPLIPERNAHPMKGFLEGRTQGRTYRLVLNLAAFELLVAGAAV